MAVDKTKKESIKRVPFKNYIIILAVFAVITTLALFLRGWYNSYQEYQNTIPVLNGIVNEVKYNEVYNYIDDNQSVIIYIGEAEDEDSRNFETKLVKLIKKENLQDKIVYFNIGDVTDKNLVITEFNTKYAHDKKLSTYPAFIIFSEGKIIDFRSKTAGSNLTIDMVDEMLNEYKIKGE